MYEGEVLALVNVVVTLVGVVVTLIGVVVTLVVEVIVLVGEVATLEREVSALLEQGQEQELDVVAMELRALVFVCVNDVKTTDELVTTVVGAVLVVVVILIIFSQLSPRPSHTPQKSRDAFPPQTPRQSTTAAQLPLQSCNVSAGYLHDPKGPATIADSSKLHAFESMQPVHLEESPPHTPHRSAFAFPPHVPLQSTSTKHSSWQSKPGRA